MTKFNIGLSSKALLPRILILVLSLWAQSAQARGLGCSGVSDCQLQVQPSINFSSLQGKTISLSCSGGLFPAINPNLPAPYSFSNDCFTLGLPIVTGSHTAITRAFNWCTHHETLTVSLACTNKEPD
jgi:hypothetical protein